MTRSGTAQGFRTSSRAGLAPLSVVEMLQEVALPVLPEVRPCASGGGCVRGVCVLGVDARFRVCA